MKYTTSLILLALLLAGAGPVAAQLVPGDDEIVPADTLTQPENPLLEGLRRPNPYRVGTRSVTEPDTIGVPITSGDRYPQLRLGLDAVSVWQNLNQASDADTLAEVEPGFQAALGNLHLGATLVEGIDVYAEFYLSVKQHQGEFRDREGWVRVSDLPKNWDILNLRGILEHVEIKAGHFEVDFGNQRLFRSDNAQVQANPLIGNFLIDPNTVEAGIEVIGNEGLFNWVAGLGSGVTRDDFAEGRGTSLHGKIWLEPKGAAWNVAASVYRVDHSDNPTRAKRGSWGELFSGNRSGSRYSGVLFYPAVNNQLASEAGQINLGQGQDELAWQVDASYQLGRVWLYGHYGRLKDSDINGSDAGEPEEEWSYFGVEGKVDLLPERIYAAGRYGRATTEMFQGTAMDAFTDRVQLGLGYWLFDSMLFKAEYVTQRFEDFTVGWTDSPSFDGFLVEGSVSF